VWVQVDPMQLRHCLVALASNACDAMAAGGMLTIEVSDLVLGEEDLVLNPGLIPGRYATLALTDTGSGITPEIKARIFDPFFTTKELGKGTGLGLTAVHGFVGQSGGSISVESHTGLGSTFKIYLPAVHAPEEAAGKRSGSSVEPLRGSESLLLAEGDAQIRSLFKEFLETLGYVVLAAGSGTEATQLAHEFHQEVHLLLTDIALAGVDGRRLAEEFRGIHPNLKVIYISGNPDSAFESAEANPDEVFIHKPIALEDLARTIRLMLDGRASTDR